VTAPRLADVVELLDEQYPPATAESWDAVGLTLGDPDQAVHRVLLAVDPVRAVVDEAVERAAQLLVTHHPLFLRPVHGFAESTPKGRSAATLVRAGIGLYTAHTNADVAIDGVNDALAGVLQLLDSRPLVPATVVEDKLVTFVPTVAVAQVTRALTDAGAGTIGDYIRCSWSVVGEGSFLPGPDAHPLIGSVGQVERVAEARLEVIVPRTLRSAVVRALIDAHPYEQVAYDIYERVGSPVVAGHGRVGELASPMPLGAFAARVQRSLPTAPAGVRFAGDPLRSVRRVAVMGGAGDSVFDAACVAGADVLVTADLRHHPVSELRERSSLAVVDPGHWASEWPWLVRAARRLEAAVSARGESVETLVSAVVTDPWTGVVTPDQRASV